MSDTTWDGTERRRLGDETLQALGALTTELAANRTTLSQLPTRAEVDLRIATEQTHRQRGFRLMGVGLVLITILTAVSIAQIRQTHDVAADTNSLVNKIDCVLEVASKLPPGSAEQQAAYGECIRVAENGGDR